MRKKGITIEKTGKLKNGIDFIIIKPGKQKGWASRPSQKPPAEPERSKETTQ